MSDGQTIDEENDQLKLDTVLRDWLRRAIATRRMKREDICAELKNRLRREISMNMLDTWTASTKQDWHIPADAVPALADILQDDTIQRQLLSAKQRHALKLGESAVGLYSLVKETLGKARELARRRPRKARGKRPRKP
jgi:hypothetical protein